MQLRQPATSAACLAPHSQAKPLDRLAGPLPGALLLLHRQRRAQLPGQVRRHQPLRGLQGRAGISRQQAVGGVPGAGVRHPAAAGPQPPAGALHPMCRACRARRPTCTLPPCQVSIEFLARLMSPASWSALLFHHRAFISGCAALTSLASRRADMSCARGPGGRRAARHGWDQPASIQCSGLRPQSKPGWEPARRRSRDLPCFSLPSPTWS